MSDANQVSIEFDHKMQSNYDEESKTKIREKLRDQLMTIDDGISEFLEQIETFHSNLVQLKVLAKLVLKDDYSRIDHVVTVTGARLDTFTEVVRAFYVGMPSPSDVRDQTKAG